MGRKKKRRSRSSRPLTVVGLTLPQERALKRRLRKQSPSEPWVEAQIVDATDVDASGGAIHYRYHDTKVFPPGQQKTAMVRCPTCGIFMPPNAFEGGQCLDHAKHEGWGPSPSARAIQGLERLNGVMEERRLKREDIPSLKREIERYERRAAKKGPVRDSSISC